MHIVVQELTFIVILRSRYSFLPIHISTLRQVLRRGCIIHHGSIKALTNIMSVTGCSSLIISHSLAPGANKQVMSSQHIRVRTCRS